MKQHQTFNTDTYTIIRTENGDLKRDFGHTEPEDEYPSQYYKDLITQKTEIFNREIANIEAQRDKVAQFETENPVEEAEEV